MGDSIMQPIYLDNNATTMIHPEVAAAMLDGCQGSANPASQHYAGRRARQIIEAAREEITDVLGGETSGLAPDRLIFTSGGTESNNLAVRGLAGRVPGRIVISAVEHPSVNGAAEHLQQQGFEVCRASVDSMGLLRLDQFPSLLDESTRLVSVMLGNNETGILQPVPEIAAICRQHRVPMHTDAIQAVGKIPVNFRSLGADVLSFSAHKFHGPVGIGGLLVRSELQLLPILFGGFQQAGLRPGTESVALVRGLLSAIQIWRRDGADRRAVLTRLRDRLEERLRDGFVELIVNGEGATRLPHTLNVAFPGVDRQALVMALDTVHVACSTGSACASGSSEPSPVLLAMGLREEIVSSSVRLSLSAFTTLSEIDQAADRILRIANDLRHRAAFRLKPLPARVPATKPI